jgi:stage II sporulation protein R
MNKSPKTVNNKHINRNKGILLMNIKSEKLTVFFLTFSILTALILPLSALFPSSEEASLYNNIIRLHVLANSDSDEDQALKLKVRDGILVTVAEIVGDVTDFDEAKALLENNLDNITAAAKTALEKEGSDYPVSVTLTREKYPTREYNGITLPAGEYTSLRVLIGEAEGQNWWCVLFPQLCVNIVSNTTANNLVLVDDTRGNVSQEEKLIEAGLTPSQIRLITGDSPEVVIRFRLLEMIKSIFG